MFPSRSTPTPTIDSARTMSLPSALATHTCGLSIHVISRLSVAASSNTATPADRDGRARRGRLAPAGRPGTAGSGAGPRRLAQQAPQAADRPVEVRAERVVLHQIGPGRSGPLQPGRLEVGSFRSDRHGPEGLGRPGGDLSEKGPEEAGQLLEDLIQRAEAAAERPQVNALTDVGHPGQVLRPAAVEVPQGDLPRGAHEDLFVPAGA